MKIHTVQLNLADFDKGTSGLSPLEFTIYTRLLLAAYERALPDNDEILARIARVEKKDIKKVRRMLEEKFKKVDGFFINSRTELEKERYKKLSELNKEKANQRWKTGDSPMPTASNRQCQNEATGNAAAILTNNQHQPPNNQNGFKTPTPFARAHTTHEGKEFKAIGDLVGGVGAKRLLKVLDVTGQLQHADIVAVQNAAPKWDIEVLAQVYVDGINSGSRDAPRSIPKAFPKWCEKYTGGKQPS